MKRLKQTVANLRRPLLGALVSLVLAGAAVFYGGQYRQQAERQHTSLLQKKQLLAQDQDAARRQADEIDRQIRRFHEFQESGVLGEEKRAQWTGTLQAITSERHPDDFTYELGEKTASRSSPPDFSSPLKVQAEVRHEVDFLQLVARLEQEIRALPIIQHCQVQRQARPATGLLASCEIELITLAGPDSTR